MGVVARHDLDAPNAERAVARMVARRHEARVDIETERLGASFAMERSFLEFANRCVADGRAAENETWLAMVRTLQAGAALFLTATRPAGEPVEFRYGEDTIRRPATGPTRDSGPLPWLETMYLAIIARDRARTDLLAGVPVELLRECAPEQDDWLFAWVRTLQLFARGEEGLIDALLQAMRATEILSERSVPETVHQLYFPPMELFYRYTRREPVTEALTTALELHRRHWAPEPRAAQGVVALGPLAMATLARDAGLPIDVESDYLPHHLLAGTRVGELST